ncbi:ABC transporter permease [Microbispora sp. NEAU-D428]|uniref:ABC transporter permease n=1 Tax=Microbispora sitophila TaxID=2771537 RepID=UPI001867156A|nr:FtsX-like permease family protein [Microbispora sitophila]MBE3009404.1 ABC transporter permease [Microbispora sitophila]
MIITTTWLRLELRRRWRSLAVLTLLVAFASATVLASVAGARRGGTAMDRLERETLPATITVLPNQPGFDWNAVRALPQVAALATFAVSGGFWVDGIPVSDNISGFPPGDAEFLHTVERPVVFDGRLPDPGRADEVVVSPMFTRSYHRRVGDRLVLRLMSREQVADPNYDPSAEPPRGPSVPVTIVGVVRSPWFADHVGEKGGLVPSPALFTRYRENMLGEDGYLNALVRLKDGADDIPAFREGLARVSHRNDIDVWNNETKFAEPTRRIAGFEAASLLAFGLAALAAAIVLIGQSVARYTAATVADLQVLRAIGLTPRQAAWVAAAGPFLGALTGATAGAVAAAVASVWMPIGSAALVEPAPGFDLDWLVLAGGWILIPALVLAGAVGAAAVALAAARRDPAGRRSLVALAAARAGLPVPLVVGARFALEPGRGTGAVPVRPALLGAVSGVLGVLAAFTFSAGVQDAAEHPERFGQTYQLAMFFGLNGTDFGPAREVLQTLAREPIVQGVNDSRIAVAESGDTSVTMGTYAPVGRPLPVVLLAGRMPRTAGEVTLAPKSADALGARVGDRIPLRGGGTPMTMTVTGIGFVPVSPHNDYSDGGWITAGGYERLFAGAQAFKFHAAEIALRPGYDVAAARERLQAAVAAVKGAENFAIGEPWPMPQVMIQIRGVEKLPVLLSVFMALLAVGAVGHALATAVRRRRHDVAVLRALGMTRRQARWTVVVQATLLAAFGLSFGVPLGVALGRTLWRVVADTMPLLYLPPLAVPALLLAGPLTVAVANLLAVRPGHLASRLRIGHILRAE